MLLGFCASSRVMFMLLLLMVLFAGEAALIVLVLVLVWLLSESGRLMVAPVLSTGRVSSSKTRNCGFGQDDIMFRISIVVTLNEHDTYDKDKKIQMRICTIS